MDKWLCGIFYTLRDLRGLAHIQGAKSAIQTQTREIKWMVEFESGFLGHISAQGTMINTNPTQEGLGASEKLNR